MPRCGSCCSPTAIQWAGRKTFHGGALDQNMRKLTPIERARKAGQVKSEKKAAHCRAQGKARQIQDEFTDLPVSRQRKHQLRKERDK